ncbi:MAG: AAA family ATPase [Gammaproteobacteria bacterium]|nr:AAA family ATPase [Gammaproteobacteria bacterium]
MYEHFYGLQEKPFSILPDPSYLFMSKAHNRALVLLRYSLMSGQGFTVLSGEIGSGKTTLINKLIEDLDQEVKVGILAFTQTGTQDILEWVAMTFGLDYSGKTEAELYETFLEFLIREYSAGRKVVLIIDEAQNMGLTGLEKLRMLSNVNARKEYLLHMILVGQPELRSLIKSPQLKQLLQRIAVAFHLDAMTDNEAKQYIRHRIEKAGGDPSIISEQAVRLLVAASDGVPRLINSLCDLALVYGYSVERNPIDVRIVRNVLEDRTSMGLAGVG